MLRLIPKTIVLTVIFSLALMGTEALAAQPLDVVKQVVIIFAGTQGLTDDLRVNENVANLIGHVTPVSIQVSTR